MQFKQFLGNDFYHLCNRMVNKRGNDIDDAETIRWLAESALVSSNLLPSEKLQWGAMDAATAKLKFIAEEKYSHY
jgi:hypothetical protein